MDYAIDFSPDYAGALARLGIDPVRTPGPDGRPTIVVPAGTLAGAIEQSIAAANKNAKRRSLDDTDAFDATHRLLNQLNTTQLSLALARELDTHGDPEASSEMLRQAVSNFTNGTLDLYDPYDEEGDARPALAPKASVLIIEDEPTEARLLLECLQLRGVACQVASDGLVAMSRLDKDPPPTAILIDMLMPRMDGVRTVHAIRTNPRLAGVPIFAISGAARPTVPLTDGPQGIDGWFPKPVNTDHLLTALSVAMAG